jgi:lysophospholipase L1-like esterase
MNVITDSDQVSVGDSITLGQLATNNNGYAQQLATWIGGSLSNQAVSGSRSETGTRKAYIALPEGYRRQVVTWMYGFNDMRALGLAAIPKITGNLRAFIAACFLNDACAASKMKRTGTWTALSSSVGSKALQLGGTGLYCSNTANKLEWQFYGDNLVIGAHLVNGASGVYQDLEISIDGGSWDLFSLTIPPDAVIRTDAKIYFGLGAGLHSVAIRPVTNTPYTVVDYVGTLEAFKTPVFIAEIPYLNSLTYAGNTITLADIDTANQAINDVVAEFLGFDIEVVKTNDGFDPNTDVAPDGIHRNNTGMAKIFNAFKDKITLI